MAKKVLTHTGAQLDSAIDIFMAPYLADTYTLPEQVVFSAALDPTVPTVHLYWRWPSTDFANGIMIRRKAGSLPQHSGDGTLVCNISGTSQITYDDSDFDEEDSTEVGTMIAPVAWYYRAFPYNVNGQSQRHYQTTANRGTIQVNVYYIPSATTLASLAVGGTFRFGHYGNQILTWKVADISADRMKVIMASNCSSIGNVQYDGPESSNPHSDRKNYGNNRWLYSNMRQWLNSYAAGNTWFEAQHDYDVAGNLKTKNGFLYGFTAAERGIIIPESHVSCVPSYDGGGSETVIDTVWLPSKTEVGQGNVNNSYPEGSVFQLFSGSGNTNANRDAGYTTNWWLRSAYVGSASYAWRVTSGGGSDNGNATVSYAVRAGLTLPLSTVIVWNSTDQIFEVQVV